MKKRLKKHCILMCIFLCFFVLLTISTYADADTNENVISLESVSCRPGEKVTVPICVYNTHGIKEANLKIYFDYPELTLLHIDTVYVEEMCGDYQSEFTSPYNIHYKICDGDEDIWEGGIIELLTFYVDENALSQDFYIGITGEIFDENGNELECEFNDALICCGYIAPHEHYFNDWWKTSMYEHDRTCQICGYSEYEEHQWYEVERKEPTKTEEGYVRYCCKVETCTAEKTEVIAPNTTPSTPDKTTPSYFSPIINQLATKPDPQNDTTTSTPSNTYVCPYKDISDHWAEDIIKYISEIGLIDGITSTEFQPNEPMTREMFVTAVARLAGIESDHVNWAIDNGILLGYGNGEYGLTDTVTREQMAVFFLRFFEKMGMDTSELWTKDASAFADDERISDWATDAVYEIQKIGLIQGKENNLFDPKGTATRAEGATVLYNLIQVIMEKN